MILSRIVTALTLEASPTLGSVTWKLSAQSGSREDAENVRECLNRSGGTSFVEVMKIADLRDFMHRSNNGNGFNTDGIIGSRRRVKCFE
jgi:hypothetical protein